MLHLLFANSLRGGGVMSIEGMGSSPIEGFSRHPDGGKAQISDIDKKVQKEALENLKKGVQIEIQALQKEGSKGKRKFECGGHKFTYIPSNLSYSGEPMVIADGKYREGFAEGTMKTASAVYDFFSGSYDIVSLDPKEGREENFKSDVNLHKKVRGGPNILPLIVKEGRVESDNRLYVPRCEGDLSGRIKKGKIPFEEALGYAVGAFKSVKHVHSKGLSHNDIKPENFLLKDKGKKEEITQEIYFAAFGVTTSLLQPDEFVLGSHPYIPPDAGKEGLKSKDFEVIIRKLAPQKKGKLSGPLRGISNGLSQIFNRAMSKVMGGFLENKKNVGASKVLNSALKQKDFKKALQKAFKDLMKPLPDKMFESFAKNLGIKIPEGEEAKAVFLNKLDTALGFKKKGKLRRLRRTFGKKYKWEILAKKFGNEKIKVMEKNDVWALGITLHELFTGDRPKELIVETEEDWKKLPDLLEGKLKAGKKELKAGNRSEKNELALTREAKKKETEADKAIYYLTALCLRINNHQRIKVNDASRVLKMIKKNKIAKALKELDTIAHKLGVELSSLKALRA